MKNFGKMWWVFGVLDVAAVLLNPYIGFFGFFNVTALFCTFCLDVNLISRERELKKGLENRFVSAQFKSLAIGAYFISIVFFLVNMFVDLVIFILAYSQKNVAAPYQIWSNPDRMSVILLILVMILNVLFLISYICRGKSFRKLGKEYDEQINAKNTVVGD